MLKDYLLEHHLAEIEAILNAVEIHPYYSIYVNFVSLFETDAESAQKILSFPGHYLPLCDKAVIEAQEHIAKSGQIVKKRVRARITSVPVSIDQGRIGELVSAGGIIVRTSQPTVLKLKKRYECKKCNCITVIELEWEQQTFKDAKECEACRAKNITPLACTEQEDCADYQEIKIQEKFQPGIGYSVGLSIILLDDLVDKCTPGHSVDISGIVIRRWEQLIPGCRLEASTVIMANSISIRRNLSDSMFCTEEVTSIFQNYWHRYKDTPLAGRNNILASICPQLYGMYTAKLALAVILAGGVPKTNKTGTRIRGEPHLLLIGDPGTGKSQLLRTASKLVMRSILTTGIGTTSAGLTAAAVKDGDGWHLEAGALVLADGGVCCVDELATMTAHDRASIHEAMEQQTISIAKAGLVCTLNSRCTVIAAINPDGGRFTEGQEWKTRLGYPLLSRFDLVLLLKDNRNVQWDLLTSEHILRAACKSREDAPQMNPKKDMELLKSEGLWKEESLREYLAHIHTLRPTLTQEAQKVLSATYLYHRCHPHRRAERTTVRLLDSLIRLAEGHARLMYRSRVELMDAIFAMELIGTTESQETNLECTFPADPMAAYRANAKKMLRTLHLENLEQFL
ncbi:hypothetical protein KM043_000333 [Ampulex compressa]|nr:hypothetical protein KM043_000333 [Ampulex compressa]